MALILQHLETVGVMSLFWHNICKSTALAVFFFFLSVWKFLSENHSHYHSTSRTSVNAMLDQALVSEKQGFKSNCLAPELLNSFPALRLFFVSNRRQRKHYHPHPKWPPVDMYNHTIYVWKFKVNKCASMLWSLIHDWPSLSEKKSFNKWP